MNTRAIQSAYPREVTDPWSRYEWADAGAGDNVLMAACIGVVKGLDVADVRRVLQVDEGSERNATLAEAWKMSDSKFGHDVVQIAMVDDAVVTFEPNGWHGVEPEIATALSERGRYAAYYWNVNAVMTFVFSERGVILRTFDPLLYDRGSASAPALPEEAGLPFPSDDDAPLTPGRAAFALIERLTGVAISLEWLLEARRPTFRVSAEPLDAGV